MDESYWSKRYENNETGWDIGEASKPLIKLFHQFNNKEIKILIPGCGNAYEAEYLYNKGFTNVYIIDITEEPLKDFKNRNPNFPENQILHGDFFEHKGSYDLIIEQTFFCAINPQLR
ncbi:MAG: methyltransferase domain-containing protein, partial [Crocinitomicaceae bacterium]